MPGDSVVEFVPDPQAERLVAAVAQLVADSRAPFVLVGGLAVAARLRTFHRTTQDLDAVVAEEQQRLKQGAIEAIASARIDDGMLTVAGVPVDVIDVDLEVPIEDVMELDDPLDRLFVSGHLFAYRDATQVALHAASATALVNVATSRALLVSKLSAYLSARRDPRQHSSDGLDVYELAHAHRHRAGCLRAGHSAGRHRFTPVGRRASQSPSRRDGPQACRRRSCRDHARNRGSLLAGT